MTQVPFNFQDLAGPDMPLQSTQRAILGPLCDAADLRQPVSRLALIVVAGLNDPNPTANNYGLRHKLGSITQRLNSSDWYRSVEDPTAPGGRWYFLREDFRDEVRAALAQ